MQRARSAILAAGGADAVNSFTRFYLALLGQIPYEACPNVPPEFLLLPKWFPVNLYSISSWSRTILVPLSIMSAYRPLREIEPERGIRELFLSNPLQWPYPRCPGLKQSRRLVSWDRFFHFTDKLFGLMQRHRITPLRKIAVQSAARWMTDRFAGSDGLGAIFPPMIWSIVALKSLGFPETSAEMRYCREQLWSLIIEDGETAHLQPCKSPVWDTALTMRALSDSGLDDTHPTLERGIQWLLAQEIRTRGDWAAQCRIAAGRLVLRVCQSVLSRLGRHGDGLVGLAGIVPHFAQRIENTAAELAFDYRNDGPQPARCPSSGTGAGRHCRGHQSRQPLDAGDAKPRRRLGGV